MRAADGGESASFIGIFLVSSFFCPQAFVCTRPLSAANANRWTAALDRSTELLFSPHPSTALEYWFFKVNTGPVSLLVDWIARRKVNEHWLRVSIHTHQKRDVLFEKLVTLMPQDNFLTTQRTVGHLDDVAWELDIQPGQDWIKPDIFPAGLLQMTDLSLVSAPLATFTGWIRHGGQQTTLQNTPGVISQYWGRQLASEWWWISANQFDKADVAVECAVLRSSLWGTAIQVPLAYLYLRQQDKKELVMAPLGLASAKGTLENFEIEIRRLGAESVTLTGVGRNYNDLGDGIANTLVGDLEIRVGKNVIARAQETAGLERRAPKTNAV
jgi:hypothetical protein